MHGSRTDENGKSAGRTEKIGEIHVMKRMTITELAEFYGRKPDTLQRKAKELLPSPPGGKWSIHSVVTEDEARTILGDRPAKRPALSVDAAALQGDFDAVAGDLERATKKVIHKRKPRTWTPESGPNGAAFRMALPAIQKEFSETKAAWWTWTTTRQLRRFTFNAVCLAIVLGHAGLIWYDCAALWQEAGQIGGGLAFLFVVCCVLLATDATRVRTSAAALWIVAGVDLAAWWVHYPVFTRQMTAYDIKVETGVLCAVICALSFFALVLYRDEKID